MDIAKYLLKRGNQLRMREAERFALSKSPICYAPSVASQNASRREAQNLKLGLCAHGKVPRLIAERMVALDPRIKIRSIACQRCA